MCSEDILLSHMLVNCIVIQKFWFEALSRWKNNSGENLLFDDLSVMQARRLVFAWAGSFSLQTGR